MDNPGAVLSFLPIILIGVLFGLAMDYQVFIASGMREAYMHGERAKHAVRSRFSHAAAVVAAAAIIMVSVFSGFIFSHLNMVRPLGFATSPARRRLIHPQPNPPACLTLAPWFLAAAADHLIAGPLSALRPASGRGRR